MRHCTRGSRDEASVIPSAAHWSVLAAHPDTSSEAIAGLTVEARLAAPAVLVCDYALHADMSRVRVPASRSGERCDGLWRHTCFEAFVSAAGVPGYYEFNFSPAGDWAAYHFDDYRHGMSPVDLVQAPALHVQVRPARLELFATVEFAGLPDLDPARQLRLALAAVIEDEAGALSYWSLQHPPGKPDFHHPDAFTLELCAP
jgi:hypothetical protein